MERNIYSYNHHALSDNTMIYGNLSNGHHGDPRGDNLNFRNNGENHDDNAESDFPQQRCKYQGASPYFDVEHQGHRRNFPKKSRTSALQEINCKVVEVNLPPVLYSFFICVYRLKR